MNQFLKSSALAAAMTLPALVVVTTAAAAAPDKKAAAKPATAAAIAQTNSQEIAEIRAQMQALADRLQKLEQTNQDLEAQNAALKKSTADASKQVQQVQADTDSTIDQLAKTRSALPEWVSRIGVKGDFRYRHEQINTGSDAEAIANKGSTQDRERDRIRARLAITAKVNDTVNVGMRLVTTETNLDPRSPNVTLSGYNSKKTIAFDQAYFEWNPSADLKLTGGKFAYPWVRPALSLFYDGDINPEGAAVNYAYGYFFANAYYFWLNEVTSAQTDRADAKRIGGQAGIKYPFTANSSLTAAVSYNKDGSVQGRAISTFFGGSTNGNSVVGTAPDQALRDEFKIVEAFVEYSQNLPTSTFGDLPLSVFGEYAKNTGATAEQDGRKLDQAYTGGISLGKASAPGSWEISYMYAKLDKNALFGQWVDSDFGGGNTDVSGHAIRAGYAPFKNTVLNVTYFINKINVDAGKPGTASPERNYDRLQLDFNFKY